MSHKPGKLALALLCTALLSAFSTGCSKSIVTAVTVSSTQQNGDPYAQVDVQFLTNGIVLPTINLPIFNPASPATTYGELSLDQVNGSTGEVKVGVDLATIAHLPGGAAQLPNGTAVPVQESGQLSVISIPIPSTRFVLYVAVQLNAVQPGQSPVAMVGVALPFTQLDAIGKTIGNSDLFLPFGISGVNGTAGIFGGAQSGTSGIGLFVDVSGLIPQSSTFAPNLTAQSPGAEAEGHIVRTLNELGRRHTRLTVE